MPAPTKSQGPPPKYHELPPAGKEYVDSMLDKIIANWNPPNNGHEHILPAHLYPCAEHPEVHQLIVARNWDHEMLALLVEISEAIKGTEGMYTFHRFLQATVDKRVRKDNRKKMVRNWTTMEDLESCKFEFCKRRGRRRDGRDGLEQTSTVKVDESKKRPRAATVGNVGEEAPNERGEKEFSQEPPIKKAKKKDKKATAEPGEATQGLHPVKRVEKFPVIDLPGEKKIESKKAQRKSRQNTPAAKEKRAGKKLAAAPAEKGGTPDSPAANRKPAPIPNIPSKDVFVVVSPKTNRVAPKTPIAGTSDFEDAIAGTPDYPDTIADDKEMRDVTEIANTIAGLVPTPKPNLKRKDPESSIENAGTQAPPPSISAASSGENRKIKKPSPRRLRPRKAKRNTTPPSEQGSTDGSVTSERHSSFTISSDSDGDEYQEKHRSPTPKKEPIMPPRAPTPYEEPIVPRAIKRRRRCDETTLDNIVVDMTAGVRGASRNAPATAENTVDTGRMDHVQRASSALLAAIDSSEMSFTKAATSTVMEDVTELQEHTGIQHVTGIQDNTGIQDGTGVQDDIGMQDDTAMHDSHDIQDATGIQDVTESQVETGTRDAATSIQNQTDIQDVTGIQDNTSIQDHTGIQHDTGIQDQTGTQHDIGIQGHTGTQHDTGIRGHTSFQEVGSIHDTTGIQDDTGIQEVASTPDATGIQEDTGIQDDTGVGDVTNNMFMQDGSAVSEDTIMQDDIRMQDATEVQDVSGIAGSSAWVHSSPTGFAGMHAGLSSTNAGPSGTNAGHSGTNAGPSGTNAGPPGTNAGPSGTNARPSRRIPDPAVKAKFAAYQQRRPRTGTTNLMSEYPHAAINGYNQALLSLPVNPTLHDRADRYSYGKRIASMEADYHTAMAMSFNAKARALDYEWRERCERSWANAADAWDKENPDADAGQEYENEYEGEEFEKEYEREEDENMDEAEEYGYGNEDDE